MDIDRYLSRTVFVADFRGSKPLKGRYERKTAAELGFKEEWLQRAIAEDVELALSPCREGGLIGPKDKEKWVLWGKEVSVKEAGGISIDVLILSESGRIGIIETKLAHNPQARREVVTQVLEYAIHLPSVAVEDLPPIPVVDGGKPLVDRDTIEKKISEGDYLLIIAGDQIDPKSEVRLAFGLSSSAEAPSAGPGSSKVSKSGQLCRHSCRESVGVLLQIGKGIPPLRGYHPLWRAE